MHMRARLVNPNCLTCVDTALIHLRLQRRVLLRRHDSRRSVQEQKDGRCSQPDCIRVAGGCCSRAPAGVWPLSADVFVAPKFGVLRTLTAAGAIASIGWLLVDAEASSRVTPVVSSRLLPGGLPLERKITRQESDDAGR